MPIAEPLRHATGHADRAHTPGDGRTWILSISFVLLLASEFRFRSRDAEETIQGNADLQVLVSLGMWVIAGLMAMHVVTDGGRRLREADLGHDMGPTLRLAAVIAFASLVSASYSKTLVVALVSSAQFVLLVTLALWSLRALRRSELELASFWIGFRRGTWVLLGAAIVASFVIPVPGWGDAPELLGSSRFAILSQHPIGTANLIGLALLLVVGQRVALRDPWLRSRPTGAVWVGMIIVLSYLLLATKARGALFATLAGIATLFLLDPSVRVRGSALFATCAGGLALFLSPLGATFTSVLLRGKDAETGLAEARTLTGRTQIFELAKERFGDRPFFGYGYQAGRHLFIDEIPWAGQSHNVVIDIAVTLGLIGLVLYVALLVRVVSRLRTTLRAGAAAPAACAREGAALLVFVLVTGMVGAGFSGGPGLELIVLVLVCLLTDACGERLSRQEPGSTWKLRDPVAG